jgi:hypothetical protein
MKRDEAKTSDRVGLLELQPGLRLHGFQYPIAVRARDNHRHRIGRFPFSSLDVVDSVKAPVQQNHPVGKGGDQGCKDRQIATEDQGKRANS